MRVVCASLGLLLLVGAAGACAKAYPSHDASPSPPDSSDGGPSDGVDAGVPSDADTSPDADPYQVVFESATTGTANSNGFNINEFSWLGWRFEVSEAVTTRAVGFYTEGAASSSVFVALVELSGPDDVPDDPGLTGSDVLVTPEVIDVRTTPGDIRYPLSVELQPGWYAVIFGTSAFGANAPDGVLVPRGHVPVDSAQAPFQQLSGSTYNDIYTDERFFVIARRQ